MARDTSQNCCRWHHLPTFVFTPSDGMDADGGRRFFLRLTSQDTPLPKSPCFGHTKLP
jgi:hypothetical protein